MSTRFLVSAVLPSILLALQGCIGGCSVLNSGPEMMAEVARQVTAVGAEAIKQMDFTQMTAGASGEIHNPEFVLSGHVATGIVFEVNARLIGGELDYNITGAGVGNAARNVEGQPPVGTDADGGG